MINSRIRHSHFPSLASRRLQSKMLCELCEGGYACCSIYLPYCTRSILPRLATLSQRSGATSSQHGLCSRRWGLPQFSRSAAASFWRIMSSPHMTNGVVCVTTVLRRFHYVTPPPPVAPTEDEPCLPISGESSRRDSPDTQGPRHSYDLPRVSTLFSPARRFSGLLRRGRTRLGLPPGNIPRRLGVCRLLW